MLEDSATLIPSSAYSHIKFKYSLLTSNKMKAKIVLIIAGAAVVTLSFTFASTSRDSKKEVVSTQITEAPIGGLALEDEK
jgi:hypothetical protein